MSNESCKPDIQIDLGGGSLVSDNISLTPEQADAAMKELMDRLAQAWDEGRKHGATYPYGQRGLATDDNPCRKDKS